jgi:hypothetical protein
MRDAIVYGLHEKGYGTMANSGLLGISAGVCQHIIALIRGLSLCTTLVYVYSDRMDRD